MSGQRYTAPPPDMSTIAAIIQALREKLAPRQPTAETLPPGQARKAGQAMQDRQAVIDAQIAANGG